MPNGSGTVYEGNSVVVGSVVNGLWHGLVTETTPDREYILSRIRLFTSFLGDTIRITR